MAGEKKEVPDADPFAQAFAEFTAPERGEKPASEDENARSEEAATGAEDDDAAKAAATGDTDGAGDDKTSDDDEAAKEAAAKGEQSPEEKPAPAAAQSDEDVGNDVLKRLSKLIKEAPEDAAPAKQEPLPPKPVVPTYNDDEVKFLSEYEKDWPDVARAESLRRRGEYPLIVDHIFKEISGPFAALTQQVQMLLERAQLSDIEQRVPDYNDKLMDAVEAWIGDQPRYLQAAYNHVISNGDANEIADLVSRYRTETGTKAAPAAAPAKAPKKDTELPADAKQAAASLAPVSSKRSVVPQGEDLGDFASAFEKWSRDG